MDKFERKPVLLADKIKENTTIDGNILCTCCEVGYFQDYTLKAKVAEVGSLDDKKLVEINTKKCNVCEFVVINDAENQQLRKKLKKS